MSDQSVFDAAYWAHQPPAVQALQAISDPTERNKQGAQLAAEGFVIDDRIMITGWDAYSIMGLRADFGLSYVPSAFELGTGSIKVSTSLADYPPFVPPAPPVVPPAPTSKVGRNLGGNYYIVLDHTGLLDGQPYSDPRGIFTFHQVATPFGYNVWFTLN